MMNNKKEKPIWLIETPWGEKYEDCLRRILLK